MVKVVRKFEMFKMKRRKQEEKERLIKRIFC